MWLSVDEVRNLTGKTSRWIRKCAKEGKYAKIRYVEGQGGNGGLNIQIHFSCLTDAQKEAYWRDHASERQPELPIDSQDDPAEDVSGVEAWRVTEAHRRRDILEKWQYWDSTVGISSKETDRAKRAKRFSDQYKLAHPGESCNRSSLLRWERLFEKGGIKALFPASVNRGSYGAYTLDDKMIAVIEQGVSQSRRRLKTVYSWILDHCLSRQVAAPSYATVRRYVLEHYPKAARVHFANPGKARALFEPLLHRDYSAVQPNDIWVGDVRTMDVLVKIPSGNKYVYVRPKLIQWVDVKSACKVGYYCGVDETAPMIALALRRGIKPFGIPKAVYMDCGKNYKSIYLNGKKGHFEEKDERIEYPIRMLDFMDTKHTGERENIIHEFNLAEMGVFELLDIAPHHSTPVNRKEPGKMSSGVARAKPIEPMFTAFKSWERGLPGWCGHNHLAVPEKLKQEIADDKLLTLDEFRNLLAQEIDRQNHIPVGWRNVPPLAFYDGLTVMIARDRDLDLLLMVKKQVTVIHSEIVMKKNSGFGVEFLPGLFYSSSKLGMLCGQKVTVLYDPMDLTEIVVTLSDGTYVDTIRKAELQGWFAKADTKLYKEVTKKKRETRKSFEQVKTNAHYLNARQEDLMAESLGNVDAEFTPDEPELAERVYTLTKVSKTAQQRAAATSTEPTPPPSSPSPQGPEDQTSKPDDPLAKYRNRKPGAWLNMAHTPVKPSEEFAQTNDPMEKYRRRKVVNE